MLALALVAGLAGCGGTAATAAERVAACLNDRGFLVRAAGAAVDGTSPGGVAFTVALATGAVDDTANPGRRRLAAADRAAVRDCLGRR